MTTLKSRLMENSVRWPVVTFVLGPILLGACVQVTAPEKPIEINLNVNVKQEVLVRLQRDAEEIIQNNAAGLAIAAIGATGIARAQSGAVAAAIQQGAVGERADGYLGIRGSASEAVRAEVEQINIKRRAVYTERAQQRGVSVEVVAAATGCQTLKRVGVGQAYSLDGSSWQVRGAGDPAPVPGNCPAA